MQDVWEEHGQHEAQQDQNQEITNIGRGAWSAGAQTGTWTEKKKRDYDEYKNTNNKQIELWQIVQALSGYA